MFNTSSGSGWIHCSISIDENFVLTFQYGRDEVKSRLLDLGLTPEMIEIQSGPVQMYFDVQRKAGGNVQGRFISSLIITLINVYVDLLVFTRIACTS